MVKRGIARKVVSLAISALLIFLIFFILIPPATAVMVKPGTPSSTSVNTGTTITFNDVNLTIRGLEKIPVNNLTFKIFNNANDQQVAFVIFYINGTEIEDYPSGKFTVTNTTIIGDNWYGYGYQNGTDEGASQNYDFGYGYGYGYGGASGYTDITFLYDIAYTTHTTGTFYAKLLVNSTSHTYTSIESTTFTVSSPSGGGGGGTTPPTEEEEEETAKEEIENLYNITLSQNFSAADTDGNGIVDTFTDPNGMLNVERFVNMSGNASFLISINGDLDMLFIWDTKADTITQVTHNVGTITGTEKNAENDTIIVTVNVNKSNWTYMEVTDQYPDNNLTVKTSDGRTISSDNIWRENNKIYVLDDPTTEYLFIYESKGFLFDVILELTADSVFETENIEALITLINVGDPGLVNATVIYTLYKGEEIIWSEEEDLSIWGQLAFNKTISTTGLSSGEYTFEVVHYYGDNQTASAQQLFAIKPPILPVEAPFWTSTAIIILVVIIIVVFTLILFWFLKIRKERR